MISGTSYFMRNQPGLSIFNGSSPFVIEDNGVMQYFIVENTGIGLVRMVSQEELETTIEVE